MAHVPSPPALIVRPQQAHNRWRNGVMLTVGWLASLLLVAALTWVLRERTPAPGSASLKQALDETAALQQRIAVLERADQVARTASAELQRQIGQRQEEIAGLRADLAFYSRLTSAGGARETLSVRSLHLEPVAGNPRLFNFTITLTQNLKPGQVASGRVKLDVDGTRANQLARIAWNELAQNQDAGGLAFSFKYFQQIKGTLLLPEGLTPNAVHVDADGNADPDKATRDFGWAEALKNDGSTSGGMNAGK